MGERAKIMLNEYTAKALLKRDDLDLDKFYSTDIKMMVKVAQQELKKKDSIINGLEKYIIDEIDDAQEELNIILQGDNLDYKNECTKEFNCIKNALDMLLNKLKELKENNK